MFFHEAVYDLNILVKQNMHVHSTFSGCAKKMMTLENIIKKSEEAGVEKIAITDHSSIYPSDNIKEQNKQLKKQMEGIKTNLQVLFGGELSAYGVNKFGESHETDMSLDYRLYTYNHYHQDFWEHPEEKTPRGYKRQAFDILTALFESGRADCIAHPFIGRFVDAFADKTEMTRAITDNELGDIMEKGFRAKVAWELNTGAIFGDPVFFRRYFQIGKELGVVFNFGTDAHHENGLNTVAFLRELKKILY